MYVEDVQRSVDTNIDRRAFIRRRWKQRGVGGQRVNSDRREESTAVSSVLSVSRREIHRKVKLESRGGKGHGMDRLSTTTTTQQPATPTNEHQQQQQQQQSTLTRRHRNTTPPICCLHTAGPVPRLSLLNLGRSSFVVRVPKPHTDCPLVISHGVVCSVRSVCCTARVSTKSRASCSPSLQLLAFHSRSSLPATTTIPPSAAAVSDCCHPLTHSLRQSVGC